MKRGILKLLCDPAFCVFHYTESLSPVIFAGWPEAKSGKFMVWLDMLMELNI